MKRSENTLMESLSTELYGKKYEWRKLKTKGVDTVIDGKRARLKLTTDQAKQYMVLKLKARQEKINASRDEGLGSSDEGQGKTGDSQGTGQR